MKELYLATYSYGKLRLSTEEMIKTAKDLGFQGMELLSPLTEEAEALLKKYDMKVINTMEGPSEDGEIGNMDLLHRLGVKYVCGTNLVAFGNHQQALWSAERLNRAGRKLSENGLKIYYHNHTHEWRVDEGEYLLETLLKNTDPDYVCLQMDAGWAICGGADPVDFVGKYPGRVEMMHVKASTGILGPKGVPFMIPPSDGDGSCHLKPPAGGDGVPPAPDPKMGEIMAKIKTVSGAMKDCIMDYSTIMKAAEEKGCKAFILERDEQYIPDPVACIREDLLELRKFW